MNKTDRMSRCWCFNWWLWWRLVTTTIPTGGMKQDKLKVWSLSSFLFFKKSASFFVQAKTACHSSQLNMLSIWWKFLPFISDSEKAIVFSFSQFFYYYSTARRDSFPLSSWERARKLGVIINVKGRAVPCVSTYQNGGLTCHSIKEKLRKESKAGFIFLGRKF